MTTLIASRRSRRGRARAALDLHHPRHRPESLDRHERAHADSAPSGAIHQKRGCANTLRTPPICARRLGACAGARRCPARATQIAQRRRRASRRRARRTACASRVTRSANSSGTVATSAPMPPATMIQPESDACRSGGYHVAMRLERRHQARATRRRRSARARASSPASVSDEREQRARRCAAIASSTGSTRRGP